MVCEESYFAAHDPYRKKPLGQKKNTLLKVNEMYRAYFHGALERRGVYCGYKKDELGHCHLAHDSVRVSFFTVAVLKEKQVCFNESPRPEGVIC